VGYHINFLAVIYTHKTHYDVTGEQDKSHPEGFSPRPMLLIKQ